MKCEKCGKEPWDGRGFMGDIYCVGHKVTSRGITPAEDIVDSYECNYHQPGGFKNRLEREYLLMMIELALAKAKHAGAQIVLKAAEAAAPKVDMSGSTDQIMDAVREAADSLKPKL